MHAPNGNAIGSWILGLDIGVASLGWAVIRCNDSHEPIDIHQAGSHLFDPATEGSALDRMRGSELPKNAVRRTARQMRRQTWRRWRRKRQLLRCLVELDLLPTPRGDLQRAEDVESYIQTIDRGFRAKWAPTHLDQQRWTYLIRATAATAPVERYELGRALYQLAQRRGFKSNRRTDSRISDKDRSELKQHIGELQAKIDAYPVPTLGAYLASLSPDEQRLRARWTSRQMYEVEFDTIWSAQAERHQLTPDERDRLQRLIFWQRPLKSQSHTIGRCSLVKHERRAPIACRAYQRFRVLQQVNGLTVTVPGSPPRPLTPDERTRLLDELTVRGDRTAAQAKKCMGLPKAARLNVEDDGETRLIGHRTDAKLREVFGFRYDSLPAAERDAIVTDLRSIRTPEALRRRGETRWGLGADQAAAFADLSLEEGYGSLSLAAIHALLPLMEEGTPYATARRQLFPDSFVATQAFDSLPPVLEAIEDLRNPAVVRALSEVRKLVNQLIRRYGKPTKIRIELARDLKNGASRREQIYKINRRREKERKEIAERIIRDAGIAQPSRDDILRVMLADECNWRCPYTGRQIHWNSLLGGQPQFDIEHIWPRARSLDDSYINKTLCYHEENRLRKRGRTPFEAYGGDPEAWAALLQRVSEFSGDQRTLRAKLERFMAQELTEDFRNRDLSDTRYIARLAADYLGMLYGGRHDSAGTARIETRTGGLTAWLRTGWGLAGLLSSNGSKNREDHRHHAIDAVVVGLTDQRAVQLLARAAAEADSRGAARAFDYIGEPFDGLRERVQSLLDRMVVTHQQSRRVSGSLHDATIYSKPHDGRFRVRKELPKLTPADIENGRLVDKRALDAIRTKLQEFGVTKPNQKQIEQILGDRANAPLVRGFNGSMVRLRRVRVEVDAKPIAIGRGSSHRFVKLANNHHTEVWEVSDSTGGIRWEHTPVTMMEAHRRKASGEPVVRRVRDDGARFLFSLAKSEHVEMDHPRDPGTRAIFRVLSISAGDIEFCLTHDGRPSTERKGDRIRIRGSGDQLRVVNAEKVLLTYLGEVRRASD